MKARVAILVFFILVSILSGARAGENTVPVTYQPLYRELDENLSLIEGAMRGKGPGPGTTVLAVELLVANGQRGEVLLTQNAWIGTLITLDMIKNLGVTGISISIPYPLLSPKFNRHKEYISFYGNVVAEAKKRGYKVLVDLGAIFPEAEFSPLHYDYSPETWQTIREGMIDMAKIILTYQPDYLSLPSEPDTFSRNVGKRMTGDQWAGMIAEIAKALPKSATKIGAGAGTWSPFSVFESLAGIKELDYLDLHIYPIQNDFAFPKVSRIAATAQKHGKGVIVGEAWLYKVARSELGTKIDGSPGAFARDAYSFWEPLDARFVENMVRMSRQFGFEYFSFFWMRNFYAYIDYDQAGNLPPASVLQAINAEAAPNIVAGIPNRLGRTLRDEIRKQAR